MPLIAPKTEGKGFEAGIYEAICYCVIDMGTQEDKYGKKHKILLGWKFLNHTYSDGNPMSYHQTFTFSMNEKARLREIMVSWFVGQQVEWDTFDFQKLLGLGCKLILAPNANGNIVAKNAMPHDVSGSFAEKEYFAFGDWSGGQLPAFFNNDRNQWKLERVKASDEYKEKMQATPAPVVEDDVPF
jgi:hypothetical protein